MFNTSGIKRESSGRTGNDRRCTGNNRDCTGNNRDGTVAPLGPKQTPAEIRQRPGAALGNAGGVPVYLCTLAILGLCRHSPGLHWGVAVARPGSVLAPV
ncbi:hypothetical protein DPMN_072805 [Dreissena polymorpha]|uniref:Uncharacterized protein n=1 Tax=Dreissena polymorpha TaxID=45954 RepID=A0A9D4BY04_DREPO|nr:hypothetical protein DPMN_072805 [Dreissena polymorpha]